ncbi:MAG: S8 family peptidase [Candidatus Eisenbacteria bacterium]
MARLQLRFLLLASTLLTLVASPGRADLSKLDARARIALSEVQSGTSAAKLAERRAAVNAAGDLDVFIEGSVSRVELELAGATVRTALPGIYTAFIPATAIDAVASLAGVLAIRGSAPAELENDLSVPTTNASSQRGAGPTFTGLNGQNVLVGDVDSGIDYGHGDFQDALGNSRLVSVWDQTVAGVNPAAFAYGNECTNAQLTAGTCTQTDPASNGGHGSHVMGTAAGDGSQSTTPFLYAGMAPRADLCMVKTNFQTTAILDGVNYIFGRATALGKNAVVNLSLGSHYGPHDGNSPFEAGLTALTGPGRVIVKSAGNERSATNIRHAAVNAAGAGTDVTMLISGSAAGRVIGIDGYYEASEAINVQITTPGGTVIGPLALGGINAGYPGAATPNGNVYLENGATTTVTGAREVYIEIGATGTTSNGTWTFRFIPVTLGATSGRVDLWRFFASSGFLGNFVAGAANTQMLVSEPGNAVGLITTAAWVSKQNWIACTGTLSTFTGTPPPGPLASFSSMGPTRDGRQKPDITAPGIAIASTKSLDYTNNCPVSGPSTIIGDGPNHIVNAGTSMAAPHTSGAVALLMQKFGAITPAFAKAYFTANAIVDANTGVVPNADWGSGKLRLGDLVNPTVTVVSPNGGESHVIGANANLVWTAGDNLAVASVDLELSRSGVLGPWETIALAVPNTGAYVWSVTGPPTNTAILRVTARDAANNTAADVSDAEWAIIDGATAALLSLFEAEPMEDGVALRWQFGAGTEFRSVEVERAPAAQGPWVAISALRSSEGGVTVAVDRTAETGITYFYRLRTVSHVGQVQVFGPLSGAAGSSIAELALMPVSPNPTSGVARAEFALPRAGDVKLVVLDLQGREVAELANGPFRAGRYQAVWSGQIGERTAPAGVYFLQLQTAGRNLVRRIIVAP